MKKWKIDFLLLLMLFCLCEMQAQERLPNATDLEQQRERLIKELDRTNSQIRQNSANKKNTFQQYLLIKKRIQQREELLETLQQEIELIDRSIDRNTLVVSSLDSDIARLKNDYAKMLRTAYRQKINNSQWMFLLSSQSVNTAIQRWRYLKQYDAYRRKQANLILETKRSLEIKLTHLAAQKIEKEEFIVATQDQRTQLGRELSKKNKLLGQLKSEEAKLATQLEDYQAKMEKLNSQIATSINRAIAEQEDEDEVEIAMVSGNFAKNAGRLSWPVSNGKVVKSFGKHQHSEYIEVETQNNGIDIAASPRAEVKAVYDGVVSIKQYVPSNQNLIIISHGSYYTVYSNLKTTTVTKGQQVKAGERIGTLGSTDSRLHFEIWKEKRKLNPERWLR